MAGMDAVIKQLHTKSALRRFLCSYLLLLAVPLAAVALTYGIAQNYVRQEEQNFHALIQQQVGMTLDERLTQVNNIILQIASDSWVTTAVHEDCVSGRLSPMTSYYLGKHINEILLSNDVEYLIYFKNTQKIYGRIGLADSDVYYQLEYENKVPYEFWNSWLEQKKRPRLQAVPYGSRSTLLLQYSVPFLHSDGCMVAALVNSEWLHAQLESVIPEGEGAYFLCDAGGELLLSSVEGWEGTLEPRSGVIREINGIKYLFEYYPSSNGMFSFYYAQPVRQYWQRLYVMSAVAALSAAVCIAFSLWLAMFLAKRNYRPLTQLVAMVSSKTQKDYKGGQGEYEFLDSQFKELFETHSQLNQQLESHQNSQIEQGLKLLLLGVPDSGHALAQGISMERLGFAGVGLCVVLFRVDSYDENIIGNINNQPPLEVAEYLIKNVIMELLSPTSRAYFVTVRSNVYALIVDCPEDSVVQTGILDACKKALVFFQERFSIFCCISVSEVGNGLAYIHNGYEQAMEAQEYAYLLGKSEILDYHTLSQRTPRYTSIQTASVEQTILHEIEVPGQGPEEGIWRFLLTAAFGGGEENMTMEGVWQLQSELRQILQRLLVKLILDKNEDARQSLGKLKNSSNFEDFQQKFMSTLAALHELWSAGNREEDLCVRVNRILENSYGDPDVNINYLGHQLDLSPSYVSKIYRQKAGFSPLDYLNDIRLNKAKELLRTTNLTVEEVGEQVGFLSSNTFIRAFKRREGITPGSYKKL